MQKLILENIPYNLIRFSFTHDLGPKTTLINISENKKLLNQIDVLYSKRKYKCDHNRSFKYFKF